MMLGFRDFPAAVKPHADYQWNVPGLGPSPEPATFNRTEDFHNPSCAIEDFSNDSQVVYCDLFGLADLNTGDAQIRQAQMKYVNRLIALGASAFRIDAAGN